MSLVLCADVHAWNHRRHGGFLVRGINRRGQHCLDVAQLAINFANEHSASLIVAGDLIDDAGPVQPQFASALRDKLDMCHNNSFLLLGNHDMTAQNDHSLALYEGKDSWALDRITWLSPNVDDKLLPTRLSQADDVACLVPFHCSITDERVRDVPLVIAHFGVYDDSFPKWCQKDPKAWHVDKLFAWMKKRNVDLVLLGDWHSRAIWAQCGEHYSVITNVSSNMDGYTPDIGNKRIIMQIGALCPTGWDNVGMHGYGTVALWDGERLSWQELPGPRFCVARTTEEETALIAGAKQLGHKLYLRRYYDGDRPKKPEDVEAYETLPLTYEKAVLAAAIQAQYEDPQAELNRLTTEWLDQFGDDKAALEAHVRRYL